MKLAIGGVQFGKNYGLVDGKKIKNYEFKKIEKLILRSDIKFIDTSINYGSSEKIIGSSNFNKLNIITKIKLPKKNINIEKWVEKKIRSSLTKLKINKIYGVLIHDYKDLFGIRGKKFLKYLNHLKDKKIIQKIGVSVYAPNDLKKVWSFWKPDIVQVPLNVLDQRFLKSRWITTLKKFKILIFVRSCFLQGLLLSDYRSNPRFKKFYKILDKFSCWCTLNDISRLQACVDFLKIKKNIDYLVIGFNNYYQFDEILKSFKNKKITKIPNIFNTNKLNLIDPRLWKIN
jgi:aryl-alcohol dehydrogenase-like predicted oxidoreductase